MKTTKLILSITIFAVLVSCGTTETAEQKVEVKTPPREECIAKIKELEAEMFKAKEIDNTMATTAIQAYTDFVGYFPTDTLSPDFLFKAGEIATAAKKYKQALSHYQNITTNYPYFKHVKESLYLQGFLYDNFLNDETAAKTIYQEVIAKYPNTNYAKDAEAAINNLGKTDEQLIEEFKKKNAKK
jgi:outer membrane protein assembly factor BamD (BamD/ComL family)